MLWFGLVCSGCYEMYWYERVFGSKSYKKSDLFVFGSKTLLEIVRINEKHFAMRREFRVPKMEEIQERDRKLLYALEKSLGFVPNVYAFMTRSETALNRFLQFTDVPTVFNRIQAEAIHLVTS